MQSDGVAIMLLGLVAAGCTTLAFVPQVIKTWRSQSTGDLSLGMFAVMVIGIVLWLIYALVRSDLPLAVTNGATLVLAGTILVLKLRHG
jgi:MtN3 and saliva related transmembrane protein